MYLFDFDGTLIDSAGLWRQIDEDFLRRRGIPWSEEYQKGVVQTILPLAAQFTREYCGISDSVESIMAEWRAMAREAYAQQLPLKPYVREFLGQCRRQGIPMAIYTSCEPELCLAALERHQLRGHFSQILFASKMGLEKHSPAAFAAVLEQLCVRPEDCCFFDDSPAACAGAKKVGMRVIGVHDRLFAAREAELRRICDGYIRDFSELLHRNP